MQYTFGQAKQILISAGHSQSGTDLGQKINNAVQALAGLSGWEFLRRLVRISSPSPVFSLPQGVSGLVRVCVNGKPASLHGTDYQFLHSGMGDLGKVPAGFCPLKSADVADLGFSPLMMPITRPVSFAAVSPYVTVEKVTGQGYRPQAPVTISGTDASGVRVSQRLTVVQGRLGVFPDAKYFDPVFFSDVESVVLDNSSSEYITLYAIDGHGTLQLAGHYHPFIKVPRFHRYQIVGKPCGPCDILAEVRIDPLPLIDDDDVIPIPSLEPIKLMMLYDWNLAMNELTTAQQYLQQAMQWLQQMQVANNTLQTPTVVNTLFEGSPGEVSEDYVNL